MKFHFIKLIILFFILIAEVHAEELFIEPDMGRAPIINAISQAKKSIDLVMYGFTDNQLLSSLIQAKQKGITVRIILEKNPYRATDENTRTLNILAQYHIDVMQHKLPFKLIHQKTLIIDDNKAIVMTFNFTHSSFKNERNFGLFVSKPEIVNEIESQFQADWEARPNLNKLNLIWSPDNSRRKLTDILQQTHTIIQIYAQNINDYKMIGLLGKAAKNGAKVTIITSTPLYPKQQKYLEKNHVKIHYVRHLIIHAKVIMLDKRYAILGSINLTKASLEQNRELSIITSDPQTLAALEKVFNGDLHRNGYQADSKSYDLIKKEMLRYSLHWLRKLAREHRLY